MLSSSRLISTRQPNQLPARLTSCCKRAQPYHPSLSLFKLVKATNHSIALRVHISNKSRRHKKGKTSSLSCPRKKKLYTTEKPTKQSHRCLEVPAIATLWSRASPVCHRRCFFGTSKPSLARLRFRLPSINQITTSQTESLTLFLFLPSISLASETAHLAFFCFFYLFSQLSIPPTAAPPQFGHHQLGIPCHLHQVRSLSHPPIASATGRSSSDWRYRCYPLAPLLYLAIEQTQVNRLLCQLSTRWIAIVCLTNRSAPSSHPSIYRIPSINAPSLSVTSANPTVLLQEAHGH